MAGKRWSEMNEAQRWERVAGALWQVLLDALELQPDDHGVPELWERVVLEARSGSLDA